MRKRKFKGSFWISGFEPKLFSPPEATRKGTGVGEKKIVSYVWMLDGKPREQRFQEPRDASEDVQKSSQSTQFDAGKRELYYSEKEKGASISQPLTFFFGGMSWGAN